MFLIFRHSRWSNLIVIQFVYPSRRLRVEIVSFTTHLYLGKKKPYRKRMFTKYSNLHLLGRKTYTIRPQKLTTSSEHMFLSDFEIKHQRKCKRSLIKESSRLRYAIYLRTSRVSQRAVFLARLCLGVFELPVFNLMNLFQ